MWWKSPLLLALCAPLAYRAWREIDDPAVRMPSVELPSRDELTRQRNQLQDLQKTQDERAFDDELVGVVARLDGELPAGTTRPASLKALEKATAGHAANLKEIREFARVHVELEGDPGRPVELRDAEMKRWIEERRAVVKGKKDEETALASRLETLNGKVKTALRGRDRAEMEAATEDVEGALAALRKHRNACEGFRVLLAWAERRLDEWGRTNELLSVAQGDANIQKIGEREEIVRHVGRYARLYDAAKDAETRKLIREEALRFCEGYVPTSMMEDAMVMYRQRPVPRDKVWIQWKKNAPEVKQYGEAVQLVRTKFDEFNPPRMESVEYYYRQSKEGDDQSYEQIGPTKENRSARSFNERRKSLTFTETALRSLLANDPVKWSSQRAMPIPLLRVEQLLEAVAKYPALFGRGD